MREWETYEEKVRDFFRELGLPSVRGKTVRGARAGHQIDVLVEFERFGVKQTWVVECKRWKTRVQKAHVLTLQRVVDDIGADRGFLLSESGFQSGAVMAARNSNVTLSNLGDLRENAAADLNEHRWNVLMRRQVALREWNLELAVPKGATRSLEVPADRWTDFLFVTAQLGTLEGAFQRSHAGAFPVIYGIGRDDKALVAQTMEDFLDGATRSLDEIEQIVGEFSG
jgi:hypothetical protein